MIALIPRSFLCLHLGLLAGSAWSAPALSISPARLDFSAQQVGTSSDIQSVTLANTGDADVRVLSVAITGANILEFVPANAGGGPFTLPTGSTRALQVIFTPLAAGTRRANLIVINNAPGGTLTVSLTGIGTTSPLVPALAVTPARLDFGSQPVGTTSTPQSLTLRNSGNANLTIFSLAPTGPGSQEFVLPGGDQVPITLGPGESRNLAVAFAPLATGNRNANLTFAHNAPGGILNVPLTGVGTRAVPTPALTVSPVRLDFGSQPVGTTSGPQVLTVTNTGNAGVTIFSIAPAGASALDFAVTDSPTAPLLLPTGVTRTFTVLFTPRASGTRSAQLLIASDAPGSPLIVPLTGTGSGGSSPLPPARSLSISPTSLNFGVQPVGATSSARTVTLTNAGTTALVINNLRLMGANAAEFALTAGSGGVTLSPGATRAVQITFTPRAPGGRSASMAITSNAPGSPASLLISGTGLAPAGPPIAPGDWPVFMHDPRQLGLAGATLDPRTLSPWNVTLGSPPVASPVVAGGVVYVGTQANGLYAIDTATHSQRWNRLPFTPVQSAPAAGPDLVVVSAGSLYGFNAGDGSQRWQRRDIVAPDGVSPMRAGDTLYIGAPAPGGSSGAMYAVTVSTGANVWPVPSTMPPGLEVQSTAAVYPEIGLLFVGLGPLTEGTPLATATNSVLALRLTDGGAAWAAPAALPAGLSPSALSVGWSSASGGAPQPAVFAAAGSNVTALNAVTGATLWTRTLPESALQAPPVVSSAAAQPATLYVGGESGRVYALDPTTGADVQGGFIAPAAPITGPMALASNFLYVPTSGGLVAADAQTGTLLWTSPQAAATGVAIGNGAPFVGTADGRLVGFSR